MFGTTGRWAYLRLRRFARSRSGKATGAAILALTALTLLRVYSPSLVTELQERTFDAYQRIKPRAYADYPVRIADIDDASIAAFGQWPWSRARLAALTNRLTELGAAVVTYDMLFSETDRTNPARVAQELGDGGTPEAKAAAAMLARGQYRDTGVRPLEFLARDPEASARFLEALRARGLNWKENWEETAPISNPESRI